MAAARQSKVGVAQARRRNGFTLIELLVALSVMALLAVLSWRSIDSMTRAQADVSARADDALTLQASLGQFKFDLDAITQTPGVNGLDWDGRVLRLTRLAPVPSEGLQVVAWTRRFDNGGQWLRWQSPSLREVAAWTQAWEQAAAWAQNASAESQKRETFVLPLSDWQIFYFRNNAWSNPLSSDGAAVPPALQGTLTAAPQTARSNRAPAARLPGRFPKLSSPGRG